MLNAIVSAVGSAVPHVVELIRFAPVKLMEVTPSTPIYTSEMVTAGFDKMMETVLPLVATCFPLIFVFIAIKLGPKLIRQFLK